MLIRTSPPGRRAHPRACGENARSPRGAPPATGSSPRVRGKRRVLGEGHGGLRLIPARAGKTPRSTTTSCPAAAHPRACGENGSAQKDGSVLAGSSPRVRGKPARTLRTPSQSRLIPARAGKTFQVMVPSVLRRAHPRACGENIAPIAVQIGEAGSSPRVRGKRARVGQGQDRDRLIPARAGKTAPRSSSMSRQTAHPRACGENTKAAPSVPASAGSSPRVRGKLPSVLECSTQVRLIPARAGKTPKPEEE